VRLATVQWLEGDCLPLASPFGFSVGFICHLDSFQARVDLIEMFTQKKSHHRRDDRRGRKQRWCAGGGLLDSSHSHAHTINPPQTVVPTGRLVLVLSRKGYYGLPHKYYRKIPQTRSGGSWPTANIIRDENEHSSGGRTTRSALTLSFSNRSARLCGCSTQNGSRLMAIVPPARRTNRASQNCFVFLRRAIARVRDQFCQHDNTTREYKY
jgi:hypothetical protein